ncbi:MAG: histidine--tRNA ligase [Candidatus Doudnabacteria bacterium]|nr:histidine--tRNA ligase [Candidatus Doudnabacteria bacterium]
MSKNNIQLLKGFRDYLPSEQIARRKIISKISEIFERFGFAPIETPALEQYELFKGKLGEDEKLMYKFKDLGDREVALRYDLTVPLARVVANYPDLPKPFKRYQVANVWRADNPQKGRFREFTQCDADIIGADSEIADAEVIAALSQAFMSLEVGEVVVRINNRTLIDKALEQLDVPKTSRVKFMRILDKMDKIGAEKVSEALKEEGFEESLLKNYEKAVREMDAEYESRMQNLLEGFGVINIQFDPYLMRGLDYYTGIIFEFFLKGKADFGSVGSGGRYDNLIGKFTGKDMPAVGGSIGLDRLFAALQDAGKISPQTAAEVIVFNLDKNLTADYLNMTTNLRAAGIDTEFIYDTAKIDKQFKYAESKNMQVAVIFGPDEAKKRVVNLKNLAEKKQVTVDLDNLVTEVKSMLW